MISKSSWITTLIIMITLTLWSFCQAEETNHSQNMFSSKVLEYNKQAMKIREKRSGDKYRPLYHYLPPENWMNDTNGTVYWNGKYHMFYQYNPNGPVWGNIHWGHAASLDLVHWVDMPIALAPTPNGPDRSGCWSGGFIRNSDKPIMIYLGSPDGICIATSDDPDMEVWKKHPSNPVIRRGPGYVVFDPCGWKEGDWYYALSGRRSVKRKGNATFLFKSKNLVNWEYMHEFHVGVDTSEIGEDSVVPDFFPLGDKYMMLFASHPRGAQYYIGIYDKQKHKFYPETHGRFSHGRFDTGNFCAGRILKDDKGRTILFGWMPDCTNVEFKKKSGWDGIQSLPWVLSLHNDKTLKIAPAEELKTLRGKHNHYENISLKPDEDKLLEEVKGNCLEIIAKIDPASAFKVGIKVCCDPEQKEETAIVYDTREGIVTLDVSNSTYDRNLVFTASERCFLGIGQDGLLNLHIFVDRSVVECVVNNREYLGKRIYPQLADSQEVRIFVEGGNVIFKSIDTWQIKPIWPTK